MVSCVEVRDLIKTYNGKNVVDGVSFRIEKGDIFSLVGPNGAGKTTILECITMLRRFTQGKVFIDGKDITEDPRKVKPLIGVMPQDFRVYDELTARENIRYFANLYGITENRVVDDLIRLMGLSSKSNQLYKKLSSGERHKVNLATALVNDPQIVFLDEPTTGLDPDARRKVWDLILELKESGRTIFLTTHYMEEAEALADTVAIIDKGKIAGCGRVEDLIREYGGKSIAVINDLAEKHAHILQERFPNSRFSPSDNKYYTDISNEQALAELIYFLKETNIYYRDVTWKKSNLENAYLYLIGVKQ